MAKMMMKTTTTTALPRLSESWTSAASDAASTKVAEALLKLSVRLAPVAKISAWRLLKSTRGIVKFTHVNWKAGGALSQKALKSAMTSFHQS